MLELTPLVGANPGRAHLSDEATAKVSPWKKVLLLVAMVGLVGFAATQMPKVGSISSTSMNVKSAVMMQGGRLVRNDYGDKCGPTAASLTPAHTFVAGRVIGCSGPFTGGLFDPSAETLCDAVNGWRICKDQNDAQAQGLNTAKCAAAPAKLFFATQQRGEGFHKCEGTGSNDVFGCGGQALGLVGADAGTCSPLLRTGGNLFQSYNGKQWSCAACNSNGLNELLKISHQLNGAASYDGGVMCCKSGATQCPSGQYLSASGCVACPVGHKCSGNSKMMCPMGYYQDKPGQSSCKKASCGYFVPTTGSTSQEPCRAGTFSKAGASKCTPAPPGYFSNAKACNPIKCPAGSFQDCDGQTSCPKPPCGHFVKDPASTVTTPCPEGTYQPDIGKTSCIDTKPGEYAGKGHCKPRLCIPGYFQNLPKQKACKPASCGKKVPGVGANTDVSCGLGEYQPQPGQSSCLPIPAGYYAINNKCGIKCCPKGSYRNSAFKCVKASCGYYVPRQCMMGQIKCPAGTFSTGGAEVCTPAPAGSIPTATQCGTKKCEPGTFQDKPGQTKCKDARCGYKAPSPGMTKEDPCPMGTYQPSTKSTVCIPCKAGSANGKIGQCSCPKCIPGTYQPLAGKTSCKDSPCGRFVKDSGATASVACPPGTYQPQPKQTGCIDAPAGTYAVGGKCNPVDCPVGTFSSSAASTKCTDAPCGTYVDKPKQTSPTNCKAGEYQPLTGQTSCLLAPTGSFTNAAKKCSETLCTPGYYQPKEGQTSCKKADCGHFVAITGASSQTPCGVGRYQPKTNQKSCLLADLGYFVAGTTACKQDKCPAGQYTDCKGQKACLKAPCGHKVVGSGKSSYAACPPGTFQDEVGKDFCKTSPAGSFSGSAYCKAQLCDPGTYQPATGQSSCKQADCGKFVDGEGRSQQQTCPAGSYQDKKGQVGCYRSSLSQAPTPGLCRKIPIYFKGPSPMKWVDAKAYCVKQGGRLAIIRNAAENAAAFKVCRGGGVEGDCWIGGTDMVTEKVWKWVDGSYFKGGYMNWSQGEPNNLKNEDCAHFWKKAGEWNDLKCVTVKPFVCEKAGSYY